MSNPENEATHIAVIGGEACNTGNVITAAFADALRYNPAAYDFVYCTRCASYRPTSEFIWKVTAEVVGVATTPLTP